MIIETILIPSAASITTIKGKSTRVKPVRTSLTRQSSIIIGVNVMFAV